MEDESFFTRFNMLLRNLQEKHGLESGHDALVFWYGESCLGLDPDDVKERIVKDCHAEGVDALLLDDKNLELTFVQAKTVDAFDGTLKNLPENEVKLTLDGVRLLLGNHYKGAITPELENLVDEYHDLDDSCDYQTRVVFLFLKRPPTGMKFVESFQGDFPSVKVEFNDFDDLKAMYQRYLTLRAPAPKRISLEVLGNSILDKIGPIKSRVFTCRAKELARIYDEHKETIFQQNVRYFLGARSRSINSLITRTASSEEKKDLFWYFNNGITIVCSEIAESAARTVITLHNAQVINGAQTTYALHDAYTAGRLADDVEIIVKAIETTDSSFIESVTLYTNSQNAIRLRDLCSNDDVQRMVQQVLLSSYGFFYERKRGELDSLYRTTPERVRLLGPDHMDRVVNNENSAQAFLAMFLNKPAQAKSEKSRIFMKEQAGFYDQVFNGNDGLLPEKLLFSWKLLKYIETDKARYRKDYRNAEELDEIARNKIYEDDFLLHSEYFILNLFKDFLLNDGLDASSNKEQLLEAMEMVNDDDEQMRLHYDSILGGFRGYMVEAKSQPKYYHNKFFKNEKSIGLIRKHFNQKWPFVEVLI